MSGSLDKLEIELAETEISTVPTNGLCDLLVGPNKKSIFENSKTYFTPVTSVDVFDVRNGTGSLASGLGGKDYAEALKNDKKSPREEPRMRIIFLDDIPGCPQKLPISAELLHLTMDTYNITPRIAGFLSRQAMPGRVVHYDENSKELLNQELWYSSIIRSTTDTDTSRIHPSRRIIDWMMTLIWSNYEISTGDNTLMIWRCPQRIKQAFLSTFAGSNGSELIRHPMLIHAFFAEHLLTLTYDFLGKFSESIYEWEFKYQDSQTTEEYTARSRAFLSLSRQIRQVATDYDILEESISQLQTAYSWFESEITPRTSNLRPSDSPFNNGGILLDVFSRLSKEVTLIRTYSGLYLQRTKIGVSECFALTTQLDAKLNLSMAAESTQMARASNQDNKALRIIQILSIIFLPASLVASIFGMGFFNTSPGETGGSTFTVSGNWWYYLAISIPLTVAILLIVFGYGVWERWLERRKWAQNGNVKKDIESGSGEKMD